MAEGDLALAEDYLGRAEQLEVQEDPLYERFRDSPAKVREALRALQANPGGARPAGSGGAATATVNDPVDKLVGDSQSRAVAALEQGRRALEQGDIASAIAWRQRALALDADFTGRDYTPESLAAELRRAGVAAELLAAPAPARQPSDWSPQDFSAQGGGPTPLAGRTQPHQSAFQDRLVTDPHALPATSADPLRGPAETPAPRSGMQGYISDEDTPRRLAAGDHADPQARKGEALRLLAMARAALDRGDLNGAQQLAEQSVALQVPDEAFGPNEPRPDHLLLEIDSARSRLAGGGGAYPVAQAGHSQVAGTADYPVTGGVYRPGEDLSRNVAAQALEGPRPPEPASEAAGDSAARGQQLYQQGLRALEQQRREEALELFSNAWQYQDQLDATTRQGLRDKLTLLRAASPREEEFNPLEEVDSQQQLMRQKLSREVFQELSTAERMRANDPRGALARLEDLRERVEQESLDPPTRRQMLALVDRGLEQTEQYIREHAADIELRERNEAVLERVESDRQRRLDKQDKLAELVERFNDLVDEQRYAEAEVLAKQARELDPDSAVVRSMLLTSKFAWRVHEQESIRAMKEAGFYNAMTSVTEASTPFDDRHPLLFGDTRRWDQLSRTRGQWLQEQRSRLLPVEQEIQERLKTKIDVRFEQQPLSEVIETMGRMAGVNVYLDPQGISAEGITSDEPVTIHLVEPISLRSALNLILEPLHLSYVIQNEVLRITSETARSSDTYVQVYNVADLVIPIPNFMPDSRSGLAGALREAISATGQVDGGTSVQPLAVSLASNDAMGSGAPNASVLAQMGSSGLLPSASSRTPSSTHSPPGGMGGAAMADFDTLITLIETTIAPESWEQVGGPGSIEGFPTNLSLVVSQTQEVHEDIADLLDQLRRLQDLQVTIEVRFITLRDSFFERIGIDFQFNIDDNSGLTAGQIPVLPDDGGPTISFGLNPDGQPTLDYDYQFRQGHFASAVPQFGGFDATTAANFGFAILSDIEVFFLMQAAQGDDRTNILQAPKVTLFNGQFGFIQDTSERPFVTSVVPVVGDFAAAHQPVVMVLSEGTSLSVQAVVSPDRRFVRLTLLPIFSSIGAVETFTFHGRTTSDSGTTVADPADEGRTVRDGESTTVEGTTVQLPTFVSTSVSTTVSVPDGGTILLGGIKRLSEGRNERGVPFLSKVPYLNRLFKNVGIGRDTQSLMMMVTPRIIIQEEEEFLQTGFDGTMP